MIRRRLDDERRGLVRTGEIVERLPLLTRVQIGEAYMVSYSSLDESNVDAAIAEEIEHHQRLAAPFEWKVYAHDRPADLRQRLERAGFQIGDGETVLVYDLAESPEWLHQSAPNDAAVRVSLITQPEEVAEYGRVGEEVFGEPMPSGFLDELTAALVGGSSELRGYLAYVDDRPVAAGRMYTHPQSHFAGLYGGGVLAGYRGRGVYRALVAARARHAVESGARYLLVDALPTSRPILERLGFERLTETWPCERQPAL